MTPLYGPEFGTYTKSDIAWLLKDLSNVELEAPTEEREEAIQNGGAHYAESLPIEFLPSDDYLELFHETLHESADRVAENVAILSQKIVSEVGEKPVLVSLARAGVPVGVLVKRYLEFSNPSAGPVPHYGISIVRGKGIDENAIRFILESHRGSDIVFVDGWTGKGAITKEITKAVEKFKKEDSSGTSQGLEPRIAVLADPGHCIPFLYGTRDDYLIPSACLNSTVSGLVSRTVLNDEYIGEKDFHGAKFYREMKEQDVSYTFIETVEKNFKNYPTSKIIVDGTGRADWSGWSFVESVTHEEGISSVNLVKPGVGETTRVLLRRVPWKILVDPEKEKETTHIRMLANERGVPIENRSGMPYSSVGLIHQLHQRGEALEGKKVGES